MFNKLVMQINIVNIVIIITALFAKIILVRHVQVNVCQATSIYKDPALLINKVKPIVLHLKFAKSVQTQIVNNVLVY